MEKEEYSFGTISYSGLPNNNTWKILGISKTQPTLISKIHEDEWLDSWNIRAEESGFLYLHHQSGFGANLGSRILKRKRIIEIDNAMQYILGNYNSAAERYNDQFASVIERERLLLKKIIEG